MVIHMMLKSLIIIRRSEKGKKEKSLSFFKRDPHDPILMIKGIFKQVKCYRNRNNENQLAKGLK